MSYPHLRTTRLTALLSFSALITWMDAKPALADFSDYSQTLSSSAYSLTIENGTEDHHNLMTYENNNGQWEKKYYQYDFHITACPNNDCSSGNRTVVNQNQPPINQNFYGLSNGALSNSNYTVGKITGDFVNNKNASGTGGAIFNTKNSAGTASIGDIEGDFIKNSANAFGGAIVNNVSTSPNGANATIGNIKGNFVGNHADGLGGAIFNSSNDYIKIAQIGNIEGDFIGNSSGDWGGAIYNDGNMGNIKGDFIGNSGYDGGAIMNTKVLGTLEGNFIANEATGYGGAIHLDNYSTIGKINADFIGNTSGTVGGAIYNNNAKNLEISGDFIGNQSGHEGVDNKGYGGAIASYNNPNSASSPSLVTITNSSFINNHAEQLGGAIYQQGVLNIVADNYSSVFSGNTHHDGSNAIFSTNATGQKSEVNLMAQNNGSINFYDDIDGRVGYKLNLTTDENSEINFHADIKNGDITIGTPAITRAAGDTTHVNFDDINNISNRNNSLIMNNSNVTFDNFALTQHHFRDLKLTGGEVNINNVDVDLAASTMGRFTADNYEGGSTNVKVNNVNVVTDGGTYTAVDFADTSFSNQIENHITSADGPVYNYAVNYLPDTGQYTFQRASIQDAVYVPAYAAVAAVSVLSDEIYSRVLSDADTHFDDSITQRQIKPFAKVFGSDDSIDLKHFAGGDSKYYGAIFGLEGSPVDLYSGWRGVYNIYAAYAQGEHKYASQRIDQQSGYVGVSGIFYKNNLFIGSTINTAITQNKSKDTGDKDKFTSYQSGIGLKAGYNYHFGDNYILQPNLYTTYTYISSDDYKTKRGARVKFSDMSNIEVAPGLKLSKKFEEGLEVYAKGRYVFNFNENQKAKANGILLPDIELKNYAEFGLGVQKDWIEKNLNVFLEISRREGGREGWNSLAGAKWLF